MQKSYWKLLIMWEQKVSLAKFCNKTPIIFQHIKTGQRHVQNRINLNLRFKITEMQF